MVTQITERTLQEIDRNFKVKGRYVTSRDKPIFCPHVNGLVNICLSQLGLNENAKENCRSFLDSTQYSNSLFLNETDLEGNVVDANVNTCRNAIMSLALANSGYVLEANQVFDNLRQSHLYDSKTGLFRRRYNPQTQEVNPLIITQTNLWIALALEGLSKLDEAKEIVTALEREKFDESEEMFFSQDCRYKNSKKRFYSDDQALACLAYLGLNEIQRASELMRTMIRSPLYDLVLFNSSSSSDVDKTKSSYKNGLCGIALGRLAFDKVAERLKSGLVEQLYDHQEGLFNQSDKDKTKIPDNSALALMALTIDPVNTTIYKTSKSL